MVLRILNLIEAILRDPFDGVGKPEPLRRELAGGWSRRFDIEHRLVYRVTDDRVYFLPVATDDLQVELYGRLR